ncbi:methionine adenosyltransferase [bacterium]|nr:methionine adenosyltransferase [bacterium]
MQNIVVEKLDKLPVEERPLEIVERKGVGHPDTICDGIMNEISVRLSKIYMKKFGRVLHHNIDKGLLVAGEAEQRFGGGEIIKPMLLIFGDRATTRFGDETIDIDDICINTAKEWIKKNLRFVDPDKHVKYQVEIKPGSAALTSIFRKGDEILSANDTSAGVGYAPLSKTEKLVLETERFLNSKHFKNEFPESGEDVKVMGIRHLDKIYLTVAMPLIDRFLESENQYFRRKKEILDVVKNFVREKTDYKVFVDFNTLDEEGKGVNGVYLTVTGTSAENADSGEVGRGNRVNGLIPLNRPVSNEAAAGKNPTSHVGKIYNLLTHRIAREIYRQVPGLKEVYVWLVSEIGQPINKPKIAAVQVIPDGSLSNYEIERIRDVVSRELDNIRLFTMDLAYGRIDVF